MNESLVIVATLVGSDTYLPTKGGEIERVKVHKIALSVNGVDTFLLLPLLLL